MDDFLSTVQSCRQLVTQDEAATALTRLRAGLRFGKPEPFEYDLAGQLLGEIGAVVPAPAAFPTYRVGLVADHTTTTLANAIRCALLMEGLLPVVYEAPFGAVFQEILDRHSGLYREPRDAVLMAFHHRMIEYPEQPLGGAGPAEELAARVVGRWAEAWAALQQNLGCQVWQHILVPSGLAGLGAVEQSLPAAPDQFIGRINQLSRERAPAFVHWVDTASLAQQVGFRNWHDPRMYYYGKFGFNPQYVRDYINVFLGAFRAATGRNRKVLITDLDNTLWGGVVGDAGLAEIKLGPGTPEGEAHEAFCRYLKSLKERGVMLAVCSKNDAATAREVFERHPHMPLRLADFSAFCCNWSDKAGNVLQIAKELNIGRAHLAFVDDNPAECELIRRELPEVAVVALPEDPADFVAAVDEAHLFDAAHVSPEDLLRAQSYRAREQAEDVKRSAGSLEAYLADLRMVGKFFRASAADVPRLAQMELKTNQFNVTTRRYNADQIRAFLQDDKMAVFACTLADRFANHGLVSTLIARRAGQDLVLDSWLMSCRVFSRTLEQFIMNALVGFAQENGITRMVGDYLPTSKNAVVKDLFPSLGFQPLGPEARGRWVRNLRGDDPPLPTGVRDDAT